MAGGGIIRGLTGLRAVPPRRPATAGRTGRELRGRVWCWSRSTAWHPYSVGQRTRRTAKRRAGDGTTSHERGSIRQVATAGPCVVDLEANALQGWLAGNWGRCDRKPLAVPCPAQFGMLKNATPQSPCRVGAVASTQAGAPRGVVARVGARRTRRTSVALEGVPEQSTPSPSLGPVPRPPG